MDGMHGNIAILRHNIRKTRIIVEGKSIFHIQAFHFVAHKQDGAAPVGKGHGCIDGECPALQAATLPGEKQAAFPAQGINAFPFFRGQHNGLPAVQKTGAILKHQNRHTVGAGEKGFQLVTNSVGI